MTDRIYPYYGQLMSMAELSRATGIAVTTLRNRMVRDGKTLKEAIRDVDYRAERCALYHYNGTDSTLVYLSQFSDVTPHQIGFRIRSGMSVEQAVEKPYGK